MNKPARNSTGKCPIDNYVQPAIPGSRQNVWNSQAICLYCNHHLLNKFTDPAKP